MKTSADGRHKITQREGNILTAYPDPATGGEPWTIGVGHTSQAGPPTIKKGMKITAEQSDEILAQDLKIVERTVSNAVKVPLTQHQFDALVSFVFNVGGGNFKTSTLLRKLNLGQYSQAADEFRKWTKAAGKTMQGLVTRREGERAQFLTKDAPPPSEPPAVA